MEKIQLKLSKVRDLLDVKFFRVLLFLILGVILFGATYSNVKPEKLDVRQFTIAEKTIRSPITVEDKDSTEVKRKEALDLVQDVYILKKEYAQNRVDLITSIFDSVSEVHKEIEKDMNEKLEENNLDISLEEKLGKISQPPMTEQIESLKGKLTENVIKEIPDSAFQSMLQASKDELSIAEDLTVTTINKVMSSRISTDDVENAKKRLEEELKYTSLNSSLKKASIDLGRFAIIQNEFYDPKATKDLQRQAMEGVEPVKILQGQILVEEGQLISRDIYRQIKLVGMLDNDNSLKPFVGLTVIIFILLAGLNYFFNDLDVTVERKKTFLLIGSIVFVFSIVIMKILSLSLQFEYSEVGYLFTAAMAPMIIKLLINDRLAIAFSVIIAIFGSLIFNEGLTGVINVTVLIYMFISGFASILFLSTHNHRSKILQAGLFVSVVNILVILSMLYLRNGAYSGVEYAFYFVGALVSGIGSSVLTIGLLPFFEAGFGLLSTMKLIELSNPNHPLLRKILTEAPGTYHHSIMVANLAETACEAIGADGLLARVGCYYHDIGKTKRPQFFIENQINIPNPHDKLAPLTSRNIIIAHAKEGADLLRKHKMPQEIIDIAEQHHGTTFLKYFHHKAIQSGLNLTEDDFRYPGPKVQTKEAAIIGIADSVEAAVRSMGHPTHEQIESIVRKIIADRLSDDQFSECDVTLKELEIVATSLYETLQGIFHSRIEYPEILKQKVIQA